ncbi:hypothetical protein NM22_13355 [Vibrio tubiashii]|nr:hypothetical protein NM22_13355 [Vibrio tubiashii]
MNRLTSIAAIVMLVLCSNAYAQEEEAVEGDSDRTKTPPSIEQMDTDGDGMASLEEFNQFRQVSDDENDGEESDEDSDDPESQDGEKKLSAFASFDKDKDGFVTQEELNAHAKYSNPGNGTGELKASKQSNRQATSNSSSSSKGNSGRSESRGNSGNKGGGNRGGGSGNKGGKEK